MRFEEPALFGETPQSEPPVDWPPLPSRPIWTRHYPGARDQPCDYCTRVYVPGRGIRRPRWHRTGVDGAGLLLCDDHAQLFAEENYGEQ